MAGEHIKGGYDVQFCSELHEDYMCRICHLALCDPCQLECGHQYCTSCIKSCKRTVDGHQVCPKDRQIIDMNKIFPDKAIARKVLSLTVKCKNAVDGCDWTGDLRALEHHVEKCKFGCICCINKGCESFQQRRFLQEHLSHKCMFRVIICRHCGDEYILKDEEDHLNICIKLLIECNNNCGEKVPRNELDNHLERKCPLAIVDCSYADLGCQHKCQRSLSALHEQHQVEMHLKIAVEKVAILNSELQNHKKISIEKFSILNNEFEKHKQTCMENTRILEDKLKHVDYIWPITNYLHMLNEERARNKSIESPPFFTSKYGYKVQLVVYSHVNGAGKRSYLALYLVILRGKYDAILKWPFPYKCKLSILHQGSETKNKTFIIDPKMKHLSPSFNRPTTVGNAVIGRPKFISHFDIKNKGFLVDNTIFLKCEIEVTS